MIMNPLSLQNATKTYCAPIIPLYPSDDTVCSVSAQVYSLTKRSPFLADYSARRLIFYPVVTVGIFYRISYISHNVSWLFTEMDYNYILPEVAPIAQLDRASVFGTEGWEFEPLWVHSLLP